MADFRFAAKDSSGKTVEGQISAGDRAEAVAELRKKNLVVLKVEEGGRRGPKAKRRPGAPGPAERPKRSLFTPKPSCKKSELVIFTRQLATMIGAGLSLLESLDVLTQQAESPGMRVCCARLTSELRAGSDLSAAMATCPKVFSPLYVSMVTAGEVSGQMDVILERLADYQESSEALVREIRSAMTYPVISLVLVLGITSFLMLGVVPTFRQVFESMDSELPAITEFVLNLSDWLKANWALFFGGVFGGLVAVVLFTKTEPGGRLVDNVSLRLPIFGILVKKISLARFSRTFSTLIRSGVPIMGTLDIVADTAGNRVVRDIVRASKESVRNGNMLSEPLSENKIFPPMVVRMIAIGERSGALEALLEKIAEFYDAQVKAQIKSLTSLIEPLLITFMGVVVGGVVLAVFLPILDIVGKLGAS